MTEHSVPSQGDIQATVLEKIASYRFFLLLMALILVADLVLTLNSGQNLVTASWRDLRATPWCLTLIIISFGICLTLGAGVLLFATRLLEYGVFSLRCLLKCPPDSVDPSGGLVWRHVAAEALEADPNPFALANFHSQVSSRAQEVAEWHVIVSTSAVCLALVLGSYTVDGALISALTAAIGIWLWVIVVVISWPFFYQIWSGVPGHDHIQWPKLARELDAAHAARTRASALDRY